MLLDWAERQIFCRAGRENAERTKKAKQWIEISLYNEAKKKKEKPRIAFLWKIHEKIIEESTSVEMITRRVDQVKTHINFPVWLVAESSVAEWIAQQAKKPEFP